MKIPLLSRRDEPTTTEGAGTAAPLGDGPGATPAGTDRGGDRTTYRSAVPRVDGGGRHADADRAPDRRGRDDTTDTLERTIDLDTEARRRQATPADARRTDLDHPDLSRPATDRDAGERRVAEPAVVAGRKPRASLLATVGLVVGVVGLLFVLTGALAGYGIGVGAVGAVLAVLGLIATRRRHVAGKTDAFFGIVAGLAAVVLGILAMTGQYDWPTTDGDWVNRFREWLDSQFVDRL